MIALLHTPLFSIMISLLAFEIGCFIYKKTNIAIFNPLLIAISLVIIFILTFNISIDDYNEGGKLISFFLSPATVVLAVPLYKKINLLKANALSIVAGITIGSSAGIFSIILFSKIFNLDYNILCSLIPKSVTTPIGIEISKQLGGIPPLTVSAIIITGIIGAIIAPFICKIFNITNKVAIGISIGTSSHAVGTTKAVELGEIEGAMSGLSIGIAGLLTVFLGPLILKLFK